MFEHLLSTLIQWNRRTSDRQKLQHTYLVLIVVILFLAGVVSLFSDNRAPVLFYIAILLISGLLANFLVWSLFTSIIVKHLPRQTQSRPAQKRR
jgi:hypothetical protein